METTTAAVIRESGGQFQLEDLALDDLRPHEIVVRVAGAGICHTDLICRDQWFPVPLPLVLGHEGSGVVEAVGSEVTRVAEGDRVVMSINSCGHCEFCRTAPPGYCVHHYDLNFSGRRPDGSATLRDRDGTDVNGHFFAQSSFATRAVATEYNVVKVDDDLPLELLGPLACGIQTGAGSVFNSLGVKPGSSIAVFGTGAVGLSAIMAAAALGATRIIGVDVHDSRLTTATDLGATDVVNGSTTDSAAAIAELTDGRGVDYTLETTAVPAVARQAVESLALLGTCGLVGVPPARTELALDYHSVLFGRFVRGIIGGDARAHLFIPLLLDLWRQGSFPFDKLITTYPLDQINQAAHDAETGVAIKPVIVMPTA
ncbi:MAG: NAD(P)-dependent alcohol dehydrogenase [Ilumatobacter fluminis]|uniref:NAD(P)-dependent alcohol dehydrogenase n=1 Tax=Ilumatobacter fluminis TaxID=467091 RepID=UPI0032EFE02F